MSKSRSEPPGRVTGIWLCQHARGDEPFREALMPDLCRLPELARQATAALRNCIAGWQGAESFEERMILGAARRAVISLRGAWDAFVTKTGRPLQPKVTSTEAAGLARLDLTVRRLVPWAEADALTPPDGSLVDALAAAAEYLLPTLPTVSPAIEWPAVDDLGEGEIAIVDYLRRIHPGTAQSQEIAGHCNPSLDPNYVRRLLRPKAKLRKNGLVRHLQTGYHAMRKGQ